MPGTRAVRVKARFPGLARLFFFKLGAKDLVKRMSCHSGETRGRMEVEVNAGDAMGRDERMHTCVKEIKMEREKALKAVRLTYSIPAVAPSVVLPITPLQ